MKTFISFIVSLCLFSSFLKAQDNAPLLDQEQEKYPTSFDKYYKQRSIIRPQTLQVLEKELEASNYIIGPGDKFKANIIGDIETEYEFEVLPEGDVTISTIGAISVGGMTLKDAKEKILKKINEYYINSKININLTGLRRFRVYLTGHVNNPGTYFAQGTDRVSDVIETAQGITDWADETRIEVKHDAGDSTRIDLSRFYMSGDKYCNPFLQGGDVINVPSIDLTGGYVIVEGNAEIVSTLEAREVVTNRGMSNLLGVFPLRKDETLYEFLKRIRALNRKSDLEHLEIVRDTTTIKINLLRDIAEFQEFKLKHRDKIFIPLIQDKVYVKGEVQNPGGYPYLANYTAKDYVGQAGALESATDLDEIVVIKNTTGEQQLGGDTIVEKGDTILVPKRGREVLLDFLVTVTPMISLLATTLVLIVSL